MKLTEALDHFIFALIIAIAVMATLLSTIGGTAALLIFPPAFAAVGLIIVACVRKKNRGRFWG